MGNKEIIFELIESEKGLTASEISLKTNLTIENVKTYLTRLKKENLIHPSTKKGREFVYITRREGFMGSSVVTEKAKKNLKFLNDFFKRNIDHLMKRKDIVEFVMNNETVFSEIEEMVKDV